VIFYSLSNSRTCVSEFDEVAEMAIWAGNMDENDGGSYWEGRVQGCEADARDKYIHINFGWWMGSNVRGASEALTWQYSVEASKTGSQNPKGA
jgi:hypothetical protein